MPQDTSYSYVSLLVGTLLIFGVLSSGLFFTNTQGRMDSASIPATAGIDAQPATGATTTASPDGASDDEETTQSDEVERHLGPVTVTILFTCSYLEVQVEPTTYSYTLALDYRDTTTGQRFPMLVGPFTGSIDDPFGETDFQLVEVQVRVEGLPPITELAPERCTNP